GGFFSLVRTHTGGKQHRQPVTGFNPLFSLQKYGGVSRAAKGADCKSAAFSFVGSSPTSPTMARVMRIEGAEEANPGGCSSMVEQQPSKLMTRVRFPSPAPSSGCVTGKSLKY